MSAPPPTAIERFDDAWYRVERGVVAAILGVMGLVVFLDVVHRVSTRAGSWLSNPLAIGVGFAFLGVLAFRTRGDDGAVPKGLGFGAATAVAQWGFVTLLPNGVVWSQTFALALTLWLGCIGASLAAHDRRHLALDVGSKIWPADLVPKISAAGHVFTAVFCVVLVWLGVRSVLDHVELWSSTGGAAGNLSGMAIPKWAAAAAIPYGMATLAFRFGLEAWRVGTGRLSPEVDELAALGIQVEAQPPELHEGGAP